MRTESMPLLSMRSRSCLRWLVSAVLVGAAPATQAAPTSVGLLAVDGSAVEPGMGAIVTDALRRNLPQLHGMRIEPRTQDLAEVKMVFGCNDERADCMTKVGRNLEVSRLIYGSIRKQGGAYVVLVRQLNVSDGTVEKTLSESVPKQILMQPSIRLDELCQRWLRSLLVEGLRGGVDVNSSPPGALVFIDGEAVGRTPFSSTTLDVGHHVIKLELTGYDQVVKTVQVRGNQTTSLDEQLLNRAVWPSDTASEKPAHPINWVPILRYSSYALYGLAAVTAVAAIGSWGAMTKAEDRAKRSHRQPSHRARSTGRRLFGLLHQSRQAFDLPRPWLSRRESILRRLSHGVPTGQSPGQCGHGLVDCGGHLRGRRLDQHANCTLFKKK